jgi:hypothetical protein
VSVAWLAFGGGLHAFTVSAATLDAWLGPLVRTGLLLVLAFSLLGYLDDGGTSGTGVWPWLVLGWCALESVATAFLGTRALLATLASPLFAAVAALGWMQVWATTPGLGVSPRHAPSDASPRPKGDG